MLLKNINNVESLREDTQIMLWFKIFCFQIFSSLSVFGKVKNLQGRSAGNFSRYRDFKVGVIKSVNSQCCTRVTPNAKVLRPSVHTGLRTPSYIIIKWDKLLFWLPCWSTDSSFSTLKTLGIIDSSSVAKKCSGIFFNSSKSVWSSW